MYLFFDTETTGLPKSWSAPVSNLSNWPRMVQIAWLLFDNEGKLIAADDDIIRPEDYKIPYMVSRIHGITQEIAEEEGVDLRSVLEKFLAPLEQATTIIGHNISFDEKIIGAEFLRKNLPNIVESKKSICTMMKSTEFCAIPNRFGYKWPTLAELHYKLFKTGFDSAHNATVDIEITAKCFWELRKLGVL